MDKKAYALNKHYEWAGKIRIMANAPAKTKEDLAVAYTPGVAEPCLAIKDDPELSYKLTNRHNTVAVITDGTAVLGLGDIGPEAGMPVMEGKCLLFKAFADIDAFPLCLRTKDTDEIVRTVSLLAGSFGGINLEDIAAPRCFEIERKLKQVCDIPVFHDDQHGTAVVVGAALKNALRLTKKSIKDVKIVVNGVGAAGTAIGAHIAGMGAENIIYVDRNGALVPGMDFISEAHRMVAETSNPNMETGMLSDVIKGADVFVGVSAPGVLTEEMVRSMNKDPIVFAMANPTPEIMPDIAKAAGARVVGTGRSDFPNQINNVLAFPGIFRGALDVRASDINEEMKNAASDAIADIISDSELSADYILPDPLDERVVTAVAKAVGEAARRCGIARN
ncbi:MAG: NADP-dependent malic enzyme [Clostridia bacterium]|nr:NADP-dependent malic enzyme [Clostridia bacterium]